MPLATPDVQRSPIASVAQSIKQAHRPTTFTLCIPDVTSSRKDGKLQIQAVVDALSSEVRELRGEVAARDALLAEAEAMSSGDEERFLSVVRELQQREAVLKQVEAQLEQESTQQEDSLKSMEEVFMLWSNQLESRLVDAQRGVAIIRQLRRICVRLIGGDITMRLEVWRASYMLDSNALRLNIDASHRFAAFQRQQEAWAAYGCRDTATRQLRQAIVRIMRGDVALYLAVWRTAARIDVHAKYEAMQHGKGGMRTAAWSGVAAALPFAATLLLANGRGVLV
jgi:hypothetical protein